MAANTNPLSQFSRAAKIYVKLPSMGKFYSNDFLKTSPNGEIPIKGMTATDDLIMNNPDALLNGDAVYQILTSCVPQCKDVKSLLIPDVETLLLGIRYASRGDTMKFKVKCPSCGTESEEQVSIRQLLDASSDISMIEEPTFYEMVQSDDVTVRVNMQPSPYLDVTNANMVVFEQTRMMQFLQNNEDIDNETRHERMKESFERMAKFQLNVLINSIESVEIIQKDDSGEEVITKVTEKKYIKDFVQDMEKVHSEKLNEKLQALNGIGLPEEVDVVCDSCSHEFKMEVKFDPTNFSAEHFLASAVKKS
jgi:tellurite resistance protein